MPTNVFLRILLFVLATTFTVALQAQISVSWPDGRKACYQPGETLKINVQVKSLPETCLDGMKRCKIFYSGLKVKEQGNWIQTGKALFRKELTLLVLPNGKPSAKITILRKVDKENLFHQEVLPLRQI